MNEVSAYTLRAKIVELGGPPESVDLYGRVNWDLLDSLGMVRHKGKHTMIVRRSRTRQYWRRLCRAFGL